MSCLELYSKVKSDNKFFFGRKFRTFLGLFLKDFFRAFLFSSRNLESCPELCSKVKSEKKDLFWEDFFGTLKGLFSDFFIFVGKSRELSRTLF